MKRILTAGVLGTALALTPVATVPAAAQGIDQERLMQVLGGLVVLGLAGKVYNDRKDRDERREAAPVQRQETWHGARRDGHRDAGRGYSQRNAHRVLPARCIRQIETRRGMRNVVGKRCLARTGLERGLPERCERHVKLGYRERTAYGLRCMRREGWRVAQHR